MITLQVNKLEKSFGVKNIFRNISFKQSTGSLGIAGSNGSGKSTLLKCMAGLLSPTRGNIIWTKDSLVLSPADVRRHMGYAAPYINLYDELNCLENLHFLAKVRRSGKTSHQNSIQDWLDRVGLQEVADQPYGKLSTGQQQRLRIASALFHQPDVLLLDEPGSNLDAEGKSMVRDIAHSFRNNHKLLIIASNNRQELDLCGRLFSVEEQAFL